MHHVGANELENGFHQREWLGNWLVIVSLFIRDDRFKHSIHMNGQYLDVRGNEYQLPTKNNFDGQRAERCPNRPSKP